jgi:hypothetical protein
MPTLLLDYARGAGLWERDLISGDGGVPLRVLLDDEEIASGKDHTARIEACRTTKGRFSKDAEYGAASASDKIAVMSGPRSSG